MKWLYIAAGIAFYVKMLVMPNAAPDLDFSIVEAVVADSGVPSAIAGVILRNRLYDTIFEVVVFTVAIGGRSFCWPMKSPKRKSISFAIAPPSCWPVWDPRLQL